MKTLVRENMLRKYLEQYEKSPDSHIFAPLAECYRVSGMYDEAIHVLDKGLKRYPSYVTGHIVLANCYIDRENFHHAYLTLKPFIESNKDNLKLMLTYAKACESLKKISEALDAYKYLLFLIPKDEFVAHKVKTYEDIVESQKLEEKKLKILSEESQEVDDLDDWQEISSNQNKTNEVVLEEIDINRQQEVEFDDLEDESFFEEYDNPENDIEDTDEPNASAELEREKSELPFMSFTLVDLYMKQGHYSLALNVIEDLLEDHPHNMKAQEKREQILEYLNGHETQSDNVIRDHILSSQVVDEIPKDDERLTDLSDLIDQRIKSLESERVKKLEKFYNNYLKLCYEKREVYMRPT